MSELRDRIASAIEDIPSDPELDTDGDDAAPDDEIIAAISRQLDVLKGTAAVFVNLGQMLMIQVANLEAELALFSEPAQEHGTGSIPVAPVPDLIVTPSGAVVEGSLPEEKRTPAWCSHDDALIVQTSEGPQRVCPECDP